MGRFGSRWPGGGGGAPSAAVVDPGMNGGRLSVDSSDPLGLGTSETLYFLPYKGNKISLWNPDTGAWEAHTIPDEGLQMAHDATNLNGGGTISYSVPYDVVCYLSGGVPTLGPWSWESTNDRDSLVARADGVLSILGEKVYRVVGGVMLTNSSGAKFHAAVGEWYVSNVDNREPYKAFSALASSALYSLGADVGPQLLNEGGVGPYPEYQHKFFSVVPADFRAEIEIQMGPVSNIYGAYIGLDGTTPAGGRKQISTAMPISLSGIARDQIGVHNLAAVEETASSSSAQVAAGPFTGFISEGSW